MIEAPFFRAAENGGEKLLQFFLGGNREAIGRNYDILSLVVGTSICKVSGIATSSVIVKGLRDISFEPSCFGSRLFNV